MAEQDLYFFNKEGDYLNFNFNDLYEGIVNVKKINN